MKVLGNNIYVDFAELPVLAGIERTDHLIVDTNEGLNSIQFNNFKALPDNTTFFGQVSSDYDSSISLISQILTLSSEIKNYVPKSEFDSFNSTLTGIGNIQTLITQANETLNNAYTAVVYSLSTLPKTPKLWCTIDNSGNILSKTDTVSIVDALQSNIYRINFTNTFSTSAYSVITTLGYQNQGSVQLLEKTTTSFTIEYLPSGPGVNFINAIVFSN